MNSCPDVQREQHVEDHGENDVQLQRSREPAFEQLVRADRVLQVRHAFGSADDLTGGAAEWEFDPQRCQARRQDGHFRKASHFSRGVFEHSPRTVEIAPGGLQQNQLVGNLMGDIGEQIANRKPTHDDEQHHCRQRNSQHAVELVAGVNEREQRAEDARVDVQGKQRLHRNVPGYSSMEEGNTLCDRVRERDEHERGPGDPEHRPDSTARKARRAMEEEAEPDRATRRRGCR